MKKSLILASCLLASSSVMAMDTQYFAGFNLEKMSLDETASWSDESKTFNLKDVGLDLKVGVILEKNHRLSLSHAEFSKDFIDLTLISGAYDYLIPINNDFKLYTGLHAGNSKVEFRQNDNFSGLFYGAQVGGIYNITKSLEFEVGLSYSKYKVERAGYITTEADGSQVEWAKEKLDKSTSMFAGINYKF